MMTDTKQWTSPMEPLGEGKGMSMEDACRQVTISKCGFPARHAATVKAGYKLDEPRRDAWAQVGAAIRNRGLAILHGDRGGGKTQFVTAMGVNWYHRGYAYRYGTAIYRTANGLLDEQRAWFGKGDGSDGPLWMAKDCGLLILDEVNEIRSDTQFGQVEIVACIDHRYAVGMPTILVTNAKPKQLGDLLGWSVMDRVKDCGALVECNWPNYRDVIRKGGAA
jgi:DNA replication protein DnaC